MYNQVISRISPWVVFRILFLTSVALFGLGGIVLGLLEKDVLGLLGGAFLGLIGGLFVAALGAIYCAIFNLLAPVIGGIKVEITAVVPKADEQQIEDQPIEDHLAEEQQPPIST